MLGRITRAAIVAMLVCALGATPAFAAGHRQRRGGHPHARHSQTARKKKKKRRHSASSLRGPTGPQGPQGPQGPPGQQGPAGVAHTTVVAGNSITMCPSGDGPCDVGTSVATCPSGTTVVGGGWDGESAPPVDATAGYNEPQGNGWVVVMANNATITTTFHAVAVCAG